MPPADPADPPMPRPGRPDASIGADPDAQETPALSERSTTMIYRRAPRISVFLILGGVVGAVVGIVAGVLGSGNVQFTSGQVIGFMLAIGALAGLALGAVAAIVADRLSVRRAHEVQAQAESSRRPRTATRADGAVGDAEAIAAEDAAPRGHDPRGTDPEPGDSSLRAPQKED